MKRIYRNGHFMSLDHLPIPRRDLFPRGYPIDVIQTTRGCPFNCDFCCVSAFNGSQYRPRPVEDVAEELKQIKKRIILFADDNILGSGRRHEERAMHLFEEIIRQKIKKHWLSQASVNVVNNHEMLRIMKKSGCKALLIGFESLDKQTLKRIGKHHNLKKNENEERYLNVVETLHKYGIAVAGTFCNTPSDSKETFLEMREFLKNSHIDLVSPTILTPLPGTRLFEKFAGELCYHDFPRDWDKFDFSRLVVNPASMSTQEFYTQRQNMIKEMHSWKRILKQTVRGLAYSKNLLLPLIIITSNLLQKRSYHHEFRRNCAEIGQR